MSDTINNTKQFLDKDGLSALWDKICRTIGTVVNGYIPETVNITYAELVELRNNCMLKPGGKYRITDYVTTVKSNQMDVISGNHRFDIIVEALDNRTLSEQAKAIRHEDDWYFETENLEAWQLWYCLDNDKRRFEWADDGVVDYKAEFIGAYTIDSEGNKGEYHIDKDYAIYEWEILSHPDTGDDCIVLYTQDPLYYSERGVDYADAYFYDGIVTVDGQEYDSWKKQSDGDWVTPGGNYYLLTERIVFGDEVIWPAQSNVSNGKGVIYRMIDEYGNDCPYDFKNIKYYYNGMGTYVYTFTWIDEGYNVMDTSVFGNNGYLTYDGEIYGVHNNTIKPYYVVSDIVDEYTGIYINKQCLNNIVFISEYSYGGIGNDGFCGCYSNSFENNCRYNSFGNDYVNNSFGNNCYSNSFGNNCYSNSFGNNCYNNSFGNSCRYNSFGNECFNNSFENNCRYNSFENKCNHNNFGNNCYNNSFGNNCYSNSFENNCYSNSFGNSCRYNSFGDECYNNSFENNCYSNSFGNSCRYNFFENDCNNNSFGDECYSNSFGNNCDHNSFENSCRYNSFENNCYSNSFGNNCRYNSFENKCNHNNFGNNCYNNSFGNNCYNNSFGNNCYNNSFGNSCRYNSFGDECFNNSFGDECYSNSFENNCRYNSFGSDCNNNSFGSDCNNNSFGSDCNNNSFENNCYSNSFENDCDNNFFENDCDNNSFGDKCFNNSFGNKCDSNSFGNNCCSNSFGSDCNSNSFGNNCDHNSFGDNCDHNSFGDNCEYNSFRLSASTSGTLLSYCMCNHFDDNCSYNILHGDGEQAGYFYNLHIVRGVCGTNSNPNYINVAVSENATYEIKVAKNSNGEIKIYCEADLIA